MLIFLCFLLLLTCMLLFWIGRKLTSLSKWLIGDNKNYNGFLFPAFHRDYMLNEEKKLEQLKNQLDKLNLPWGTNAEWVRQLKKDGKNLQEIISIGHLYTQLNNKIQLYKEHLEFINQANYDIISGKKTIKEVNSDWFGLPINQDPGTEKAKRQKLGEEKERMEFFIKKHFEEA